MCLSCNMLNVIRVGYTQLGRSPTFLMTRFKDGRERSGPRCRQVLTPLPARHPTLSHTAQDSHGNRPQPGILFMNHSRISALPHFEIPAVSKALPQRKEGAGTAPPSLAAGPRSEQQPSRALHPELRLMGLRGRPAQQVVTPERSRPCEKRGGLLWDPAGTERPRGRSGSSGAPVFTQPTSCRF